MLAIPFSDEPGTYYLAILLEDENLDRMKRADPAIFNLPPTPQFAHMQLKSVLLGRISPDGKKHLLELIASGDGLAILRYVTRGFEYRPDLGDHDGPPLSLRTKGETKQ